MTTFPLFACYGALPSSTLSALERRSLQALKDARGFFKTRGLSASDISRRIGAVSSLRQIGSAARSLVRKGFAEEVPNVTPVRYRIVRKRSAS